MTYLAGQKVAASDLDLAGNNGLQMVGAAANSHQAMTTTATDIAGASVTFTTQYANAKCAIWAIYDVDQSGTTSTFIGTVVVDGATLTTGEAHNETLRNTCGQMWITTLTSAGSHTIKIQGKYSGGSDTVNTNATHTKWHALVFSP